MRLLLPPDRVMEFVACFLWLSVLVPATVDLFDVAISPDSSSTCTPVGAGLGLLSTTSLYTGMALLVARAS